MYIKQSMFGIGGTMSICMKNKCYFKWVLVLTYVKPCVLDIGLHIKKQRFSLSPWEEIDAYLYHQGRFMLQITNAWWY